MTGYSKKLEPRLRNQTRAWITSVSGSGMIQVQETPAWLGDVAVASS